MLKKLLFDSKMLRDDSKYLKHTYYTKSSEPIVFI
jgi:hypothetical protein